MTNRPEVSTLERAWIWFWYNDFTRVLVVMMGVHLIPTVFLLRYFEVCGDVAKWLIIAQYSVVFYLAMIYNDYTNLRKIGMDEFRNKLPK